MKLLTFLTTAFVLCLTALASSALAQEVVEATQQVCIGGLDGVNALILTVVTGVIAVASALANVVSKQGFFGKLIHFLAVNIKVDKVK